METITSKQNQWIKKALQLKIKKYRERYNMFILEGYRGALDAWVQEIKDCICLLSEEHSENPKYVELVKNGRELGWKFYSISDPLMKEISGTEHGQGILLLVNKIDRNTKDLLEINEGNFVLLDGIQDPGNMGTLIRTCAAAGIKGILLTKGCTDIYAEKVVRSSMGSILRIPVYENITLEFLKKWKEKTGISYWGTTLTNSIPYKNISKKDHVLFIFGNEGNGISEDVLSLTDQNIYIPMAGTVESLNVSTAAAIVLFHFNL